MRMRHCSSAHLHVGKFKATEPMDWRRKNAFRTPGAAAQVSGAAEGIYHVEDTQLVAHEAMKGSADDVRVAGLLKEAMDPKVTPPVGVSRMR